MHGFKCLFLLICVCLLLLWGVRYQYEYYRYGVYDFEDLLTEVDSPSKCPIPRLDPWHPSILSYIKLPTDRLICKSSQPELTFVKDGLLMLDLSTASKQGYASLKCRYRCFDRATDDKNLSWAGWSDLPIKAAGSRISCEFVNVECHAGLSKVYSNVHVNLVPNNTKAKELLAKERKGKAHHVIMIVLDSISHSQFLRALPKTHKVLQQLYGSVVFDGMVKVGDNSYPNALTFLAGTDPENVSSNDYYHRYLNDMNFIWKDFARAGYLTFMEEDFAIRDTFNYVKKGFKESPTDHYMRAFWLSIFQNYSSSLWSVANDYLFRNSRMCFGNQKKHMLMMDHFIQFLTKYHSSIPKFALLWNNELLHEFINDIAYADDDLSETFTHLYPLLNDSFLFIFGDHGHRISNIRNTAIGQLELRMPYMSLSLPSTLRKQHPEIKETMKENSKLLNSFYDIYTTMQDILMTQSSRSWDHLRTQRDWSNLSTDYGESLLRPMSKERTCKEAGIPEQYCICSKQITINTTGATVVLAGEHIVDEVNKITGNRSDCARFKLSQIYNAVRFEINGAIGNTRQPMTNKYRITVETEPAGALFEATLKCCENGVQLLGDVERTNRYGNQSHCVKNNQFLEKYCYCI